MGFKLRSGNGPLKFKMMGSRTPLEYNSPIHEEEESEEENGGNDENGDDNGDNDDKGGGRTKKNRFMDALTRGVTYGLSEVYGIDKEKWDKDIKTKKKEKKEKKEEEEVNTPGEEIAKGIIEGADRVHNIRPDIGDNTPGTKVTNQEWQQITENVEQGGYDMDNLLENQKNMDRDSKEWCLNQNVINAAYGRKTRDC